MNDSDDSESGTGKLALSSDSDESTDIINDDNITNKRKMKNYKCIFEYESHNQVVERMNEPIGDSTYRFRYKRKCLVGEKHYYFCNGNLDCPKSVYVLYHSESLKASIWLASGTHLHKIGKPASLPPKSVAHIKKLFEESIRWTNREIIASLKRNNCPQLHKTQINNLKSRMKEKRIGAANCYLHQLKEWAESHQDIPENDDVVFCGGFSFVIP